jgi:hypothetical protein
MVALYSYLLTQGFLEKLGIVLSDEEYSRVEQRALRESYSSKKGFAICIIDFTLYILERALEYKKSGDFTSFMHNETAYTQWAKEADRILNLAPFTSNLSAHNTSYFSFIADLKDAIEKGEAYSKFSKGCSGVDPVAISRKLNALRLLDNTEITRRAAQQERSAPMGVLIYGSSSIAKSAFSKMLFNYYGSLFDLDRSDEFRYVRNPMDEYWSNFNSSKWCIQFDELAFLNPAKSSDVDATLKDMLNVVNNVPYVPPQASLEDKGKTPVMAKLVLATTNCVHLNAHEYFQCPLAVRRRLPFVVQLKPKKEFLHENEVFIDPLKIRVESGKFPDLWDIELMKIVPIMSKGRELARLDLIQEFSDIATFLQAFGKACIDHEANQKRAMSKDVDMNTVTVCKACFKPLPHEECLAVQNADASIKYTIFTWLVWLYQLWFNQQWMWSLMQWCAKYQSTRYMCGIFVNAFMPTSLCFRYYGMVAESIRSPKFQKICALLVGMSVVAGIVFGVNHYTQNQAKKKSGAKAEEQRAEAVSESDSTTVQTDSDEESFDYDTNFGVQGGVNSNPDPEDVFKKEESRNVWYQPNVELAPFDVPKASQSLVGVDPSSFRNMFQSNCVHLEIRHGGDTKRVMRGFYVQGQVIMTNAHAFREGYNDFVVTVSRTDLSKSLGGNLQFSISRDMIAFHGSKDLCMFQVLNMPPCRDALKFMSLSDNLPYSSGFTLRRDNDGAVTLDKVYAMNMITQCYVPDLAKSLDVYVGVMNRVTEIGMCGSIFVADTPRGPIIAGVHVLGNAERVGFMSISRNDIESMQSQNKFPFSMKVQGGSVPSICAPGITKTLGPIHHKSNFRYVEEGSGNVYGSFNGFRPRAKSNVTKTPMCETFLQHYGRDHVEYDKPAMSGWEPWQNNLRPMLKRTSKFDEKIMMECAMSYFEDIKSNLPAGWEKELIELSTESAINGIPGVKFIDRINVSTSMGFPWATSKKKYLVEDKSDKHPEGVNFTPEILELIEEIERDMKTGERSYPVFTGHLKDEATPLKKCEIKKTRVFTAAPLPHTIAVRKKLLTMIRLIQKNPFVFECMAGTVVQSTSWTTLASFLTQHGKDTMIAGDFSAYDKNMEAQVILLSFYVLYMLVKEAGWSEDDATAILTIGYDTAFSFCNFNGDLVEFFGTNPSGHALTVIVNSMVNSMYTRYCYRVLNPAKEVRSFRQNVALATYGDDNEMGVSPSCPWFNHCSISEVYASVGIKYTMADKEAESVPYIPFSETSFLKRSWVWSDEVNAYLAPLDEESIVKSLTMWVPSKSIDKYQQMVAVISSANAEYFFYGRARYEEKRAFFEKVLEQEPYLYYVSESTLPTYDELVERFKRASAPM